MSLPTHAEIIEVGLRDGLQNETVILPTEVKVGYVEQLLSAGVRRIQVTSFVNPSRVPQMADAEALCALLPRRADVEYSGLVLNMKGLERLMKAGLGAVDMGVSASNTHSLKNTGRGTAEMTAEIEAMIGEARRGGLTVRAGIQCAFGCVYEGAVPQEQVTTIARRFLDCGVDELALADSTGMANPEQVKRMLEAILPLAGETPLVLHLHDTRGLGLANVYAALYCGVNRFDTAFGGLGGCPFIVGAAGNIATEDTAHLLHELGIETGIAIDAVAQVSRDLAARLGKALPGKLYALAEQAR